MSRARALSKAASDLQRFQCRHTHARLGQQSGMVPIHGTRKRETVVFSEGFFELSELPPQSWQIAPKSSAAASEGIDKD